MNIPEKHKPKVLLIGIDAADPDYLERRFSEGALPNLARLRRDGAWGRMRSTFPVLSSAAWSTISTGLPPEKHGIYEFFRRKTGTWQDEPIHGRAKIGEDVWHIAAKYGLRTVTLNMPITYPPKPIPDGLVVSGMDTPGEATEFVFPAEEKNPLLKEVPDYRIELTAAQFNTIENFLEATSNTMKSRKQAAFYLFERWRPDLAIVIFTALDRVLHALWKYMDPAHPAYKRPEAEKWRKQVDRLYDEVDTHFGELLDWAGPESTILVCSDHGGAAVHGIFYLNRWLMREGFLQVRGSGKSSLLKAGGNLQQWVKRNVPRPVKNFFNRLFPSLHTSVEIRLGLSRLDPERTRLYSWRKTGVIRVNLAGREPGGIIQPGQQFDDLLKEAATKLENVVDPRNGHKPIRKVWTRYEAYPTANVLDDCPDLVIEWNDKLYEVDTTFESPDGPLFTSEEEPDKPWREEINGAHALYGIFGACGKGIASGIDLGTLDVTCVAPSVLATLGIDKSGFMPGEAPGGMIMSAETVKPEETLAAGSHDQPVKDACGQEEADVYSDEERELIEKRLRDLGYM